MNRTLLIPALVALALLGAALSPTGASALPSRGHVFAGTFEGEGEHALSDPTGVAVDEATGEVYVVDKSSPHEAVERFAPDGKGGYQFVSSFAVKSPEDIAVDNSTSASDPSRGDVYVVGAEEAGALPEEHDVLYKYSPTESKVIFKKTIFHSGGEELELEDIYGVAVDAAGTLWVYWEDEGDIAAFSNAEVNRWEPARGKDLEIESTFECRARPGFAVAPDDQAFYVAHERENDLEECSEEEPAPALVAKFDGEGKLIADAVDHEDSSGIAIDDQSGDAYLDNEASIAAFSSSGEPIQRFGEGQLVGAGALAFDASRSELFAAEPAQGRVAIFSGEGAGAPSIDGVFSQNLSSSSERLIAQIDPHGADTRYYFQYGSESCLSEAQQAQGSGEAQLASCTELPAAPGADVGAGFGAQSVSQVLEGLSSNTTYYYRVIAANEHGAVQSQFSTETFFTTLPSAAQTLADDREWELVSPPEKHGAAIEPISREGALIQAATDGDSLAWAASTPVSEDAQGNRRPEPVQVISSRGGEGWSSKDIATPHDRGEGINPGEASEYRFFSANLSLALVQPQVPSEPSEAPPLAPGASEKTLYRRDQQSGEFQPLITPATAAGVPFGGRLEFAGASEDMQHLVFSSEVPLTQGGSEGLYEWRSGAPLSLISLLPSGTPAPEAELGDQGRDVRGAISSDGSRVIFTSGGELGPLYMRDSGTDQTIQINAAQGPGTSEPDEEERSEGLDEVHFQYASSDGSRVFFTDTWPLSSDSSLEPLSREEVIEEEPERTRSAGRAADLYEYDLNTHELSDLSADQNVGQQAEVLGTIPGASQDGSDVYFVANGVLAPGAQAGDCPRTKPLIAHPQDFCNLYLSAPDPEDPAQRQTRLIARLSDEDAGDWGGGNSPLPGDLGGLSSQVSANGRYLAFMSSQELTGYGNVDQSPAAKGAHDEEVFLYDAADGRISCASCDPSGQPPHGVLDQEEAGEGLGLTVDRPETWSGHWLAGSIPGWTLFELNNPIAEHQSRYLTNSGRLFFNGADALSPDVSTPTREERIDGQPQQVGVENVYQYEPQGQGSCSEASGCVSLISSGSSTHESAFLDGSEDGNDVFFLTASQLVAEDQDNSLDVYDARVCGSAQSEPCLPERPLPPPPCSGEGCRAPAPAQLSFQAPATTSSGPGNPPSKQSSPSPVTSTRPKPLSRAQKLKRALAACRKLRHKHKRLACERKARKAYGVKGKHKGASKAKNAGKPSHRTELSSSPAASSTSHRSAK